MELTNEVATAKCLPHRYVLTIRFKIIKLGDTKPIIESFKTLNEATSYNNIIDNTVSSAYVIDRVTMNIFTLK